MRVDLLRTVLVVVAILLAMTLGYFLGRRSDEVAGTPGSTAPSAHGARLQLDTGRVTLLPGSSLAVDPELLRPPAPAAAPTARSTSER